MARDGAAGLVSRQRTLTDAEVVELRARYHAAVAAGRNASALKPEAKAVWQALYDYVGTLDGRGRSGRQIALALDVQPQRVSQMLAKAKAS